MRGGLGRVRHGGGGRWRRRVFVDESKRVKFIPVCIYLLLVPGMIEERLEVIVLFEVRQSLLTNYCDAACITSSCTVCGGAMILQYTNLIIRPTAERDLVILHFEMSPTLENII